MSMISPAQAKAGRALLGWSQDQLAVKANVSVTTVRNLESGEMSLRSATMNLIHHVMERAGIEFTDGEGVRRRNQEVKIFGSDELFEDMLLTVRNKREEIISVFPALDILIELCGIKPNQLGRLQEICRYASVKCLLGEPCGIELPLPDSPEFRFRTILKQHIGYASYFVYGTKQAMALTEGSSSYRFLILDSLSNALNFRKHFFAMWNAAPPVYLELKHSGQDDSLLSSH